MYNKELYNRKMIKVKSIGISMLHGVLHPYDNCSKYLIHRTVNVYNDIQCTYYAYTYLHLLLGSHIKTWDLIWKCLYLEVPRTRKIKIRIKKDTKLKELN